MKGATVYPNEHSTRISSPEALGITGFSCFFAWFLLVFFGTPPYVPESTGHIQCLGVQALGFTLIFALARVLHAHAIRLVDLARNPAFLAAAVLCGTLAPVLFAASAIFTLPVWCAACCIVPASFCAILFLISWEDACSRIDNCYCLRYMCFSLGGGVIVYLLLRYTATSAGSWAFSIALLAASAAMLHAVQDSYQTDQAILVLSPDNPSLDRRIALLGFAVNVAMGCAWATLVALSTPGTECVFGLAGTLFLCTAYLLFIKTWRKQNTISQLMRISITGVIIGLVAPLALPTAVQPLCLALGTATWLLYWAMMDSLLVQHARNIGVAGALYLAPSKIAANGGFAFGWLIGALFAWLQTLGFPPLWGPAGIGIAATVAIMCVIPFLHAKDAPEETGVIHAPKPVSAETKLMRLKQLHGLTPRETDIAQFLLQGRNAQAIAEKFVLSENTVRTHIYNIYKKTGVHSQQELMEHAESIAFDPLESS